MYSTCRPIWIRCPYYIHINLWCCYTLHCLINSLNGRSPNSTCVFIQVILEALFIVFDVSAVNYSGSLLSPFPVIKQDVHLFFCGGAFFKRSSVVFVFSSQTQRQTHTLSHWLTSDSTIERNWYMVNALYLFVLRTFTSSPFRIFSAHLTWKVAI